MPFTFSHPAIILPLRCFPKTWFAISALIIGSLTPDFEYFIRMKVKSDYSHTISGIFWFDLPLAILLLFIFHNIIQNSLFQNLPLFMQNRILIFNDFNWNTYFKKNWSIVLISAVIGISSHILWDSFTHNHGYFVDKITFLRKTLSVFGIEIPVWKITQHGSSLIGAIVIIISFLKLPLSTKQESYISKKYWTNILLFTAIITTFRFVLNSKALNIGNLIVTIIASILISLAITPLLIKFKSTAKN